MDDSPLRELLSVFSIYFDDNTFVDCSVAAVTNNQHFVTSVGTGLKVVATPC